MATSAMQDDASKKARTRIAGYPASSASFDWIVALISIWITGGLFVDGRAHTQGLVDDTFFTPWHAVLYSGVALMLVFLAITHWRNVGKGYAWANALPRGYLISLLGAGLFGLGGVLDLIWHTLFGIEVNIETLYSPTHLFLAVAGVLMISGPIRSAMSQYGRAQKVDWRQLGPAVLSGALIFSIFSFFTEFAYPQKHTDEIYAVSAISDIDTGIYSDVYIMNADGTGQTRVAYQAGMIPWTGDWSPDGEQVVIAQFDENSFESELRVGSLYIMNRDGSDPRQLTDMPDSEWLPSWSPDGTRIAFLNNWIIYTINVDGSDLKALTDDSSRAYMPVWSPDSTQIVFNSNRTGTDYIYVMNADGSDVRAVVTDGDSNWGARWSPDGSQIVYHSYRDDNSDIYFRNVDGTNETRLTTDPTTQQTPAWSRDGQSILFASDQTGVTDIYRINLDGSGLTNLSNNPVGIQKFPIWSPDGSQIMYTVNAYSSSEQLSSYDRDRIGVSSILIQATMLAVVVLFLVRHWTLPLGALTLVMGTNALLMGVLTDQFTFVLPALIAGLVGDFLLIYLKPMQTGGWRYYGFAFAFPFVYYALFFLTLQLTSGIVWTIHLWLGTIAIAGLISLLFALLLANAGDTPRREAVETGT